MHMNISFNVFFLSVYILFALGKKQDKADSHKEREGIKSRKHFTVFSTPWRSTNVLQAFPLCVLLLFPLNTQKSLNPNPKTASFKRKISYKQYFPQLIAT